eukprot:676929-Prorocentrum_minimum.AAC.1
MSDLNVGAMLVYAYGVLTLRRNDTCAVDSTQVEAIERLASLGATLDYENKNGETAMSAAARANQVRRAQCRCSLLSRDWLEPDVDAPSRLTIGSSPMWMLPPVSRLARSRCRCSLPSYDWLEPDVDAPSCLAIGSSPTWMLPP